MPCALAALLVHHAAQADDLVRDLVEKSGIPYVPMSMAKGLLPDTHPLSAGAARSTALKDSDVVLLVGARLNWLLSHGKGKAWGDAPKKFIQVDIEPTEMDSNVEIVAPVVGDIGSCVAALLEGMGAEVRTVVLYTKPGTVHEPAYTWRRTGQWITFPWSAEPPVTLEA